MVQCYSSANSVEFREVQGMRDIRLRYAAAWYDSQMKVLVKAGHLLPTSYHYQMKAGRKPGLTISITEARLRKSRLQPAFSEVTEVNVCQHQETRRRCGG